MSDEEHGICIRDGIVEGIHTFGEHVGPGSLSLFSSS